MQRLWIFSGLMLLFAGMILTYLLRRKNGTAARKDSHGPALYIRLHGNRSALRLIQKLTRTQIDGKDIEALQEAARPLLEHLLRINQELRQLPALPAGSDGDPRLMDLARDAADQEQFTVQSLLDMLINWEVSHVSPQEAAAFPVYVAVAQCQRLTTVLRALLSETHERSTAARLARRLQRCKRPESVLEKNRLNSIGLAALLSILRAEERHQLLALVNAWLEARDISAADITLSSMNRQIQLAEEIRRAQTCFTELEKIQWRNHCSKADHLHPLLMHDPSGIYGKMTADSQLQLRLQIGQLSRHTRTSVTEVLHQALILCNEAEKRSLESYIGYWFQDAEGLSALHRALPTRRGWLYAHLVHRGDKLRYASFWIFGITAGLLFLQGHQPVFMLPFFALTVGNVIRYMLRKTIPVELPRIDISSADADARTLVVLYAMLHDPHEAIQAVRRLKTIRHAFPKQNVDFLLLGDFAPSITGISSGDLPIIQAVTSALAALGSEDQTIYLQRTRTWDSTTHSYGPRAGLRGAVSGICRLIAQGEYEDTFAYATVEASALERKYAYVLSLPADCQPAHGMLEHLLQTIAHPLCQRYPTHKGFRGYSLLLPEGDSAFDGTGLIRPDSFLEATDGLLPDHLECNAVCGELAGLAQVQRAYFRAPHEAGSWDQQYGKALSAWKLSPWQLPWVQTPSGLVRNPLKGDARFRLREKLRHTLVPLGQFVLLFWAVLTENWWLLFLTLFAPEVGKSFRRPEDFLQSLCQFSLLPMRVSVNVTAMVQLLRQRSNKAPDWLSLEVWVQGLSATIMAALVFVVHGFAVPALAISIIFACFSLAHRFLATPVIPSDPLTDEHIALLDNAAASSWRFFLTHVNESNRYLPPCTVQFEPALGQESTTSPEAIGAYLLSCVCAKEMAYLSADEAALRIRQTLESTATLSFPFGLPCRRYALPSLTVQDACVDAGSTGFLLCTLMTVAQALRSWLPELSAEYSQLSAEATRLADSFDLTCLYDREAMLFHTGLDSNGQGVGYIDNFADESLMLSIAACAKGLVPPEHIRRLKRTRAALRHGDVPISRYGTAASHLLSGLFFPIHEQDAVRFIRSMASRGQDELLGQDTCRFYSFDPTLRFRRAIFGIQEIASSAVLQAPVFAPHAAALCLPFAPKLAGDVLVHFRELGALGAEGFCDAVDLTQGTLLVGLHDAYHLGITFMAASHILADSAIRRYFCALPEVEACLPLLTEHRSGLVLPAFSIRKAGRVPTTVSERQAQLLTVPTDSHLIGTSDFHMIANANGCSMMYDGNAPLTRHATDEGELHGIQFYLADEGRIYRLGSALQPGRVAFAAGRIRYEQVCGSLRAELTCTVDTVHRRALHIISITNLSTRDRLIELADFLQPDLHAASDTLEFDRPEKYRLALHDRSTKNTLYHTLDASPSPLSVSVCSESSAFVGRVGSLHHPASLEEPAQDLTESTTDPCLSFRIRMTLGGRGQANIWFTTALNDVTAPLLHELSGIMTLASLQHSAIREATALTEAQEQTASRMVAPIFAADTKIAFILNKAEEIDVLRHMISIADWFHLHGEPIKVCIVCPSEHSEAVTKALDGHVAEAFISIVDAADFTPSEYQLLLRGDLPLNEQIDALYTSITPANLPSKRPVPALLPKKDLLSPCKYGGFEPETSDFIIQLEPEETTPAPWENHHNSRYFSETVDESGFRTPFAEQVWLQMEDGMRLSPWSRELPRAVRIGPGQTDWEAWSDKLDIRLCAGVLPGHRCWLRVLHVRNATDAPLALQLYVWARLDTEAQLESAPGIIMTNRPDHRIQAFIAGDDWTARRTHAFAISTLTGVPPLNVPDFEQGRTALLSCAITLQPHASGKAVWLSGYARHSEDIARALKQVQAEGTSALLRSTRATCSQLLDTLTLDTPEDTLTLLMNRILPLQALCAEGIGGIPALIYLAPKKAKCALLRAGRKASTREEWAHITLLINTYNFVTKDSSLLDVFLPHRDSTIYACCAEALTSLPLDSHGLPLGNKQARQCLLYAIAAQALDTLRPDVSLQEMYQKLLTAADTYLWQDSYYGFPLSLDVQHLACRAYGSNVRTRQAVQTCWKALYDQPHGLIRQHEPTDAPPLPGLPQNGGMVTLDAVCFLHALLQTEHADEAFELLRALNPLHHTDDPVRLETFRCAPYQLHGGMCATPMEAGRAVPEGGNEAAAMLYAVVLHDILGFHREGSIIRINPCVPPEWEDYTITLREGASTWRISVERRIKTLTIDGDEVGGDQFSIHDDGKIHRVRFPLTDKSVH